MTATRSKSGTSNKPLRQSRLDFAKAPAGTSSFPAPGDSSSNARARTRSGGPMIVHKGSTTRSGRNGNSSRLSARFLGSSTGKKQTYLAELSSDEEDDAVIVPVRSSVRSQADSENLLGRQFGAFVFDETGSEDEHDDKKAGNDDDEEEEEDDVPVRSSASRKRKRKNDFVVDDDEDSGVESAAGDESDSDVQIVTPRKKPRSSQKQDEDDLADDLEFLRSSPPAVTPRGAKSKKDERTRALEELKRQREKRKPKSNNSSQKRQKMVVLDSDDESAKSEQSSQSESSDNGSESDSEVDEVDAYEVFDEQEDDQEFIEDDDEDDEDGGGGGGRLGVPTSSIPIAFTSWATAKPRELFRFGVEWFVQKKINPAFNRDDEIYQLTWQKLNDEITGLVGSKFTSSAWNRDFTYSLQSRPKMKSTRVEATMQDCEACNRTGHPATWVVQFTGAPYDTQTYEDVEQDSDEEEEGIARDQRGHKIPSESRVYSMGATCFKNANIAHRLKHWRYDLGQWVLLYLEKEEFLESDKIVERDGWKESRRRKEAEQVVQRMEDEGEIQSLYRTMKGEVNSARGALDQY